MPYSKSLIATLSAALLFGASASAFAQSIEKEFEDVIEYAGFMSETPANNVFCGGGYCEANFGPNIFRMRADKTERTFELQQIDRDLPQAMAICGSMVSRYTDLPSDAAGTISGAMLAEAESSGQAFNRVNDTEINIRHRDGEGFRCEVRVEG